MNIDKKIYYCWVGGGEKPDIFYRCKKSWEENMPDYEIIEVNESNFDVEYHKKRNKFFRECCEKKIYSYINDYVRVHYLYENSGIYVDTDVEILKDLTPLIEENERANFISGYEDDKHIGMHLFIAEKHSPILKDIIDFYEEKIYNDELYTIPMIITKIFNEKYQLKKSKYEDIKIYPKEYLTPFSYGEKYSEDYIKKNTYAIHWFNGSWLNNKKNILFLRTKHLKGFKKLKFIIKLKISQLFIYKVGEKKIDTNIFKLDNKEQIEYINNEYFPSMNISFRLTKEMNTEDVYILYQNIKYNKYNLSKLDKEIISEILLRCLFSTKINKKDIKYFLKLLFDNNISLKRRKKYIKRYLNPSKYKKYIIYKF